MTTKTATKLSLKKITVANLTPPELRLAVGGLPRNLHTKSACAGECCETDPWVQCQSQRCW